MPKITIPPMDLAYFDQVTTQMKLIHAARLDFLNTPIKKDPPPPEPNWTPKQQQILNHFKTWNYGCQHREVTQLVSILSDIPLDVLQNIKSNQNNKDGGKVKLCNILHGMFVKLISKSEMYGSKVPVNTVFYMTTAATSSGYVVSGSPVAVTALCKSSGLFSTSNLRYINKDDPAWRNIVIPASNEEIERYINKMRAMVQYADAWESFYRIFPALDKLPPLIAPVKK